MKFNHIGLGLLLLQEEEEEDKQLSQYDAGKIIILPQIPKLSKARKKPFIRAEYNAKAASCLPLSYPSGQLHAHALLTHGSSPWRKGACNVPLFSFVKYHRI